MRVACEPVNDLGRIVELSGQTKDEVLRWRRGLDASLTTWLDEGQAVLSRSDRGRVRLVLRSDSKPRIFESTDARLTGDLVVLWTLADAYADPD